MTPDVVQEIVYVGKTTNIKNRINQHFSRQGHLGKNEYESIKYIEYIELPTKIDMDIVELYYINKWNPRYNTANVNHNKATIQIKEDAIWMPYSFTLKGTFHDECFREGERFALLRRFRRILNGEVWRGRKSPATIYNVLSNTFRVENQTVLREKEYHLAKYCEENHLDTFDKILQASKLFVNLNKSHLRSHATSTFSTSKISVVRLQEDFPIIDEWHDMNSLAVFLSIRRVSLLRHCKNKGGVGKGFRFMWKDDYEEYIKVSSTKTINQWID